MQVGLFVLWNEDGQSTSGVYVFNVGKCLKKNTSSITRKSRVESSQAESSPVVEHRDRNRVGGKTLTTHSCLR